MGLKNLIKSAGNVLQKNSPYILTALGCVGVVSTAVFTAQATIKAKELIDENESCGGPELTPKEKVELCWKFYVPAVVNGALSIACILCANSENMKRQAALATLYSVSESNLKEYRKKVIETLGETKEEKIRDEVVQEKLVMDPVNEDMIIITGHGNTLCYDIHSGRYFKSDIETIRRVVNDMNHEVMGQMWVPLNDFYYALGIGSVKLGEKLGWTTDELLDVTYTTKLATNGQPCLVIDYDVDARGI